VIKFFRERPFLTGGLVGGAMIVSAFLFSGGLDDGVRDGGEAQPHGPLVASRDLYFKDRNDGTVAVIPAGQEDPIAILPTGDAGGFLRVVLRGLVHDRRSQDLGPEQPFRVSRWSDGRVTLEDLATGRVVELNAFGPTNAAAFARFLDTQENG